MTTRTKVLVTTATVGALVLGGAGTAYAAHYQDRALRGSTVSGVPVAGMTRDQVAEVVRERADAVTVTLQAGAGTRTAHLAELGYGVDVDATVDAVFAANASWSSYPRSLVSAHPVDPVVRTDPARTRAVVEGLASRAGRAARDARVERSDDGRSFEVVPAVVGRTVDPASFQDVVADAARRLAPATATVRFVDAVPEVTTAEAEKAADRANALVTRPVKVSDGEETHEPTRRVKASWVSVPSTEGGFGAPKLDTARLQAWVEDVAQEAAVQARDGQRNVTSTGDVRVVVVEARDGRVVENAAAVATAAQRALAAGKGYKGAFSYKVLPAKWADRTIAAGAERLAYPAADGEKWIDVDLGKHTMTAYVGAKRVYGPIKMVNGSDKKPTVVGTFHVYYKRELQTMRGSNADGSKYETPDVPWISYFHRGFALHGAPWRTTFGYAGERGSHGCINLPVPVAKWVYDFAPIGTTVTTHH